MYRLDRYQIDVQKMWLFDSLARFGDIPHSVHAKLMIDETYTKSEIESLNSIVLPDHDLRAIELNVLASASKHGLTESQFLWRAFKNTLYWCNALLAQEEPEVLPLG